MFDKNNYKIVIMMYGNVMHYPPVINLVECLLNNHYKVYLVCEGIRDLPQIVLSDGNFSFFEINRNNGNNIVDKIVGRIKLNNQYRHQLDKVYNHGDIIWTINSIIIRILAKRLKPLHNRHIMQLFELLDSENIPMFGSIDLFKFNIGNYSRRAWKNVVVEKNRAYIQKANWNLDSLPYILPNKPYYMPCIKPTDNMNEAINIINSENRKIILYLGVIGVDRNIEAFAEAIELLKDEYCLILLGKLDSRVKESFSTYIEKYDCIKYLGFFNPPYHLCFLKYAHIALIPYSPGKAPKGTSNINALYCAPNKIYEYAGNGIPMLGTDVLGLREPFEKYGIGVCCDDLKTDTIISAIKKIESNYKDMVEGCKEFYEDTDLDAIINRIINE